MGTLFSCCKPFISDERQPQKQAQNDKDDKKDRKERKEDIKGENESTSSASSSFSPSSPSPLLSVSPTFHRTTDSESSSSSPPITLELGTGHSFSFRIQKEIKASVLGSVVLVEMLDTKELWVAKMSSLRRGARETPVIESSCSEIQILRHIWDKSNRHPSYSVCPPPIVKFHSGWRVGENERAKKRGGESYVLFMEYCAGGDVMQKVLSEGLSELETKSYFAQLCEALAFLHACHIYHLDISPENMLLVGGSGQENQQNQERGEGNQKMKISDFGMAVHNRDKSSRVRHFKGNPLRQKRMYRAPEVNQETREYNGEKADMWSAGVCLWLMLTKTFPYRECTATDYGFQQITESEATLKVWLATCNSKGEQDKDLLVNLLFQIFQQDPSKRPTAEQALSHPWTQSFKQK